MSKSAKIIKIIAVALLVAVVFVMYGFLAFLKINSVDGGYRHADEKNRTLLIAHRGLSSDYYQNTFEAFWAASENVAFGGIECDVWRTKDGVWVCCHDENPFEDESILISECNYSDAVKLPLKMSLAGERVDKTKKYYLSTLDDYLDCISADKYAFIEIKKEYDAATVNNLMAKITSRVGIKNLIMCSFKLSQLQIINDYNSRIRTLAFTKRDILAFCYTKMNFNVGCNKIIMNKKTVERLHSNNKFVLAYTITTAEEKAAFTAMGVDFVVSDYAL